MITKNHKELSIISSCNEDWGGSEELWGKCIPFLTGIKITVYKKKISLLHPAFIKLAQLGVKLVELQPSLSIPQRIIRKIKTSYKKYVQKIYHEQPETEQFFNHIKASRPDLVLIAQGINFDGLIYAHKCLMANIPYVIISQKAVDFYWPPAADRQYMKEALLHAEMCFFVSNHNKKLTEEQFGMKLEKSKVVFNPVKTALKVLPHPATDKGYRLACIGRLFIIDKGQDLLLRIMAKEKWRNRLITISFIGNGSDQLALQEMAAFLKLDHIEFVGHIDDIDKLWLDYHALVLPSRSEGLPLAMIEAMSVGRTVIVSNAGGNREIISDGINGFISEANEQDFESAMERAWSERNRWNEIGEYASKYVSHHIPPTPEKEFAAELLGLIEKF